MSLRFLHIPKTGGSTLTAIIKGLYPSVRSFSFSGNLNEDLLRWDAMPEEEREGIGIFLGHAPLRTGIKAADEAPTITLLRHPLDRVRSFCQHVAEGKSAHLARFCKPFDLDRFLECGDPELCNLQTSYPGGPTRAKQNLLALAGFGLTEDFSESLRRIGKPFGWGLRECHSLNVCEAPLPLSNPQIDRLLQMNLDDLDLWLFARAMFYAACG